MGRLGGTLKGMMEMLSPRMDRASALLASLAGRRRELEPEDRLWFYLRLREARRKMGIIENDPADPEVENTSPGGII